MNNHANTTRIVATLALCLGALLWAGTARAHCDALDGPVVTAARRALEAGDVNLVLVWVQEQDAGEIRHAFERTRSVRALGAQAKELADTWFFETLVRIHRAGEGAPFTGLAHAGRDLGPAIPLADRSLESGDVAPLVRLIEERVRQGLRERFELARKARDHARSDVAAGREYVHRYVEFIHFADGAWQAANRAEVGHAEAAAVAPAEHHH
jgi:hypothetical protein